ncbi:phosphoenolpyruvate carboxylase [Flavobacterium sediminilitoris]|uniref:Phosphoenolpyruvate carboxylase n=1 Tax=Flavobacterium sediminilitoris TaxID=2024526 RepID=A0ABY4HQR8_9FLAO|nr:MULTISPECIES: phosphoenolpyruvate carboxylase [Flavobacterium]UOX34955.1 phosphoenolpyruvate carboxylase [Flavobacterium sediminilitoris]
MYSLPKLERFEQNVASKFNIYNSIFITLPFDEINNTGVLLPLFADICEHGYKKNQSPEEIFDTFVIKYLENPTEDEKTSLMFRFIQYVERQVVLFDAIEDASFDVVNNMEGRGSLRNMKERAEQRFKKDELITFLNTFKVRTVLTAHPTQFYPGSVLGIITDLTEAIKINDLNTIKELLAQLGKTPFIKKEKPTPFDEAVSIIWYLENVFYHTIGEMMQYVQKNIFKNKTSLDNDIFNLGFWPGGDRDGNPFVTTEITLKVADRLRTAILKCYYLDIRKLKRKLTFAGVEELISSIENKLYRSVFYSEGTIFISQDELANDLQLIKSLLIKKHQSLYLDEIENLISKLNVFGYHFATLDIRQNSKMHQTVFQDIINTKPELFPSNYNELDEISKINILSNIKADLNEKDFENDVTKKTLSSIKAIKSIQERNGELGCNRYIISNNENALNVIEALSLFQLTNWKNPSVDIVPLFESVEDLQKADKVMEQLYTNPIYKNHLSNRKNIQTIMLGFSDGTKDGGYLMANWGIYNAKIAISNMSRKYNINVVFFDGRGGPPARGGGKTNQFYASLGPEIENKQIQLTVQGQTISSNFGTLDSCRYNLENLLSAGANNQVFHHEENHLTTKEKEVMQKLSEISYQKYIDFKSHPKFVPYLENMSTLNYYAKTNIGSRPSKRKQSSQLNLDDLRAIPFVGSWSQLKQNVPGFFGVGTALKYFEQNEKWDDVQNLYNNSLFFKTLLENSMMALSKSFFPLTAYMKNDPEYGVFWNIIHTEYLETKRLLLKISGFTELMENYPDGKASVAMREKIVLPLLTIQQYALLKIKTLKESDNPDEKQIAVYEKIVTRSLFGNINASRNSA